MDAQHARILQMKSCSDGRIVPIVVGARLCQNHLRNLCDFGCKGDCRLVHVHSALKQVYPDTEAIAGRIEMIEATIAPCGQIPIAGSD